MATERGKRLAGAERREQVLKIAAEEFAEHGLHGVSAEVIARKAGITHAYVFRLFGTKKQLFLEVVRRAFATMTDGLATSAGPASGMEALAAMGQRYDASLKDRTLLLLQLQAFAACGDDEVREAVRESFGQLWATVSDTTGLDAVQIKTFMAFGMLLNTNAALAAADVDADWARQATTRIHAGLFSHLTTEVNR
ncbi:TetR family transcriptional regulator (plasmid) [Streptomyces nigrescens]|uniref:TetR family transcriptional regulator n=2 Tax=Streptomyces TaxID=1883 RepID=A0ABM8A6Y5_STRNI|nr:TetR/AcrR family transcriptional regulator [Streptomyces nigrescens]MEE4418921.1 TetR/AcrR family transcriptional regulator [Streptomyces sp. DSM 41528]BDM74373.1 TetR family transcriptional regulator [Streptomyces nigrescens]